MKRNPLVSSPATAKSTSWVDQLILRGRGDPVWWIQEVLGDQLWSKQEEICRSVVQYERTACPACFSDDTEILTEHRGFQLFENLKPSDQVASYVDGKLQYVAPQAYYKYDYDGSLIGCCGDGVDFLVTPNHRLLFKLEEKPQSATDWSVAMAETVFGQSPVYFNKEVVWEGDSDGWTARHYACWGLWCANGAVEAGDMVTFTVRAEGVSLARDWLSVYELPIVEYAAGDGEVILAFKDPGLAVWFTKRFGAQRLTRTVPDRLKMGTRDQLKGFIDGFFLADVMCISSHRVARINDLYLAEALYEITLKAGLGVKIQRVAKRDGRRMHLCWTITVSDSPSLARVEQSAWYTKNYRGKVYCVQVPSGLVYVRRNGVTHISHNSYGVGKTFLAARLALWFLYCYKPAKVVTTAPCYDNQTEVLTDQGWRLFKELTRSEKVASRVDGRLEFVTPSDWLEFPFVGDLIGYKDRNVDFLVTPNHKLFVKPPTADDYQLIPAYGLFGDSDVKFNKKVAWVGTDTQHSTKFYMLLGVVWYTGSVTADDDAIWLQLAQPTPNPWLEQLLAYFEFDFTYWDQKGEPGYYELDAELFAVWCQRQFGPVRHIPLWIKNAPPKKLKAFIRGMARAAWVKSLQSFHVDVNGKLLADELQEVGLKAGYGVDIVRQWEWNQESQELYRVQFYSLKNPRTTPGGWYREAYDGMVYCVTVPTNILLVRRGGIAHWSGNTLRQVRDLLWKELRTAHQKARYPLGGSLLQLSLSLSDAHFAVGFSTDEYNTDKFTGFHSPNQLVIFDQAAGLAPPIWTSAEGLMTSANCRWLAISNTAISDSEMANICLPSRRTRFGKWNIVKITALDSPNVVAGRDIYPGLVSHDWVKRRTEAWGKDDPLYKVFIDAEFVETAQMVVIPPQYIPALFGQSGVVGTHIEIGVDVARAGLDSTVFFARSGGQALEIRRTTTPDTMEVVGMLVRFRDELEEFYGMEVVAIKIDIIGPGGGVYDRAKELELKKPLPVMGVTGSNRAVIAPERYANIRAELAWSFRRKVELGLIGFAGVTVDDVDILDYLRQDVSAMRYSIASTGKILIWGKEQLKSILGRSPDYWDAAVLAYETPGGLVDVEFMSGRAEKEKSLIITDEEWNILLGISVPVEDPSFRLLAM